MTIYLKKIYLSSFLSQTDFIFKIFIFWRFLSFKNLSSKFFIFRQSILKIFNYLSYFYLRKFLSSKSLSFLYLSSKIFTFPQSISKIFIFLFLYQNIFILQIFIFLKYILKTNIFFHFYLGFWGAKIDYTAYLVGHIWSGQICSSPLWPVILIKPHST